ncbi:putative membrane protein [Azospirillum lipoferum]|uniref:DUF2339 domain-containing protein n=1 Tax=Azospirillum lipoferum TaxID=193 RepID=A0A5A9GEL4_AZOLI|nr:MULTISPECIES: DUF2339 domain-containing protein [Azospirillum]KAA0591749.1 DUF2339 domain-containing protein [Azospirillum lipoferum]MCP1614859.1 putative membrane protein [Azospirillum lipoferum]MDW5536390.1 DUF2339 domain-containing protein [Azospirillum sp. NL1]
MEFVVLLLIFGFITHRLDRRLKVQAAEIALLRGRLDKVLTGVPTGASLPSAAEAAPAEATVPEVETPPEEEPVGEPVFVPEAASIVEEPAPPPTPAPQPAAPAAARPGWRELEESLASRWLIWLGGGTMALAAAFFIKLSVDHGWLGPSVRVALGLLAGLGLMVGGEWLRRRPMQRAVAALQPDYVPPALTAAGLFTAFISVYGGFALFGLFAPLVAFALLVGLSLAAIGLSLLQGPFIAALGLLAGYVSPILVSTGNPDAWSLFAYLLALNGAGMAVVLYRGWRWLGWGALAGAAVWPLLWMIDPWRSGDELPTGLYLLLTSALFLVPAVRGVLDQTLPEPIPATGWRTALPDWIRRRQRHPADRLAMTATMMFGVLVAAVTWLDSHGSVSQIVLALFALLAMVGGRRTERIAGVAWIAALTVLLSLAPWSLPYVPASPPPLNADGQPLIVADPAGYPAAVGRFLWVAGGFAALFGIGGFVALWDARRAALWASLSALVPLALLTLAYALVEPPETAIGWPAAALGLAALLVGATTPLGRHRHRPGASLGLAAFAAGATGAIALGATMVLQEAWLTVALAMQVPVLAWLERQLNLRELRGVTLLVAAAVLVRLAINPSVLDYEGYGWIAYGYGLPALGFILAARWMRSAPDGKGDDLVVMVLEAGALIFTTLMLSLGIHRWMAGSLQEAPSSLAEVALHTLSWLGLALLLAADRRWNARPVAVWGRRLLVLLAVATALLLHLVALNPLWNDEWVGNWPVVNRLLLAYGAPAVLGLVYLWYDPPPSRALRSAAPVLPLLLIATNLALEIRRAFQGPILSGYEMSDAEWYSYSAGFLLFAVAMLVVGIRFGWGWMRHAGLVLVLAVVAKVFLSDMSDLEGMYRVASFLGLGLSLVGTGWLYQRLLRPPSAGAPPEPEPEPSPADDLPTDSLLDQRTH